MAAKIVVPALGVALTGHLLRKLLARWLSGRYGGLESLVSYSSRVIAAARAMESLRPDAFVVDPLAYILAGPQAMAEHKEEQQQASSTTAAADTSSNSSAQQQQQTSSGRPAVDHHTQVPAPQKQNEEHGEEGSSSHSSNTIRQALDQHSSQANSSNILPALPTELHSTHHQQQQQQHQMQRPIPRLIMRTVFFDDAVLAAVGSPAERMLGIWGPVLQRRTQQGLGPCKQVVLLGSGMDSRPWRLDLPPNTAWFEVDRHDVLRAKQHDLRKSGVCFQPQHNNSSATSADRRTQHNNSSATSADRRTQHNNSSATSADRRTNSKSHVATGTVAESRSKASNHQTYLKAASWNCAAVDLQVRGWSNDLVKAGLNPQQPTVWVAEGLMYYLEPECVADMLQEVASISAPGSILSLNFLLESGLRRLLDIVAGKSAASPIDDGQGTPSNDKEPDGQLGSANSADGRHNGASVGKGSSNIVGAGRQPC